MAYFSDCQAFIFKKTTKYHVNRWPLTFVINDKWPFFCNSKKHLLFDDATDYRVSANHRARKLIFIIMNIQIGYGFLVLMHNRQQPFPYLDNIGSWLAWILGLDCSSIAGCRPALFFRYLFLEYQCIKVK